MRKKIAVALTAGIAAATVGLGAGAVEARPANPGAGGACVQDGIAFLKDNGLFQLAVKKQIDYSTIADPVAGPIFTTLPKGSNLSLGQVVSLHATNPNLFAWCR
jgi:hypothetical protein